MRTASLVWCVLMLALIGGSSLAQSWNAASSTGLTFVDFSKVGNEYTMTLRNLTGIPGDPTVGYDVLVWTLEPFNVPAPETILVMPAGWEWDGAQWKMFELSNQSQKYYTPPALAPGASVTFKYESTLTTPANSGGPANGGPGFLCHIAAVDSSAPGSATQRWYEYYPDDRPQTWFDRSEVPEPGAFLALGAAISASAGFVLRRRKIW